MLPFTLDPVLLEMEGWRYTGPILLGLLVDLVTGRLGGVSIGGNTDPSSLDEDTSTHLFRYSIYRRDT